MGTDTWAGVCQPEAGRQDSGKSWGDVRPGAGLSEGTACLEAARKLSATGT